MNALQRLLAVLSLALLAALCAASPSSAVDLRQNNSDSLETFLTCNQNGGGALRRYDLAGTEPFRVSGVSFGVGHSDGSQVAKARVFAIDHDAAFTSANLRLLDQSSYGFNGSGAAAIGTLPMNALIEDSEDDDLVIEAFGTSGAALGVNTQGETAPTYVRSCQGTGSDPTKLSDVGFGQFAAVLYTSGEERRALDVAVSGSGDGSVTADPGAIDCHADPAAESDCSDDYAPGTTVTLTATPETDSTFDGFTGPCAENEPARSARLAAAATTCTVTLTESQSVSASFSASQDTTVPVTVTLAGSGSGSVSDDAQDGGEIYCFDDEGATCQASYEPGTQLTLYASPDEGSTFGGFSGVTCDEDEESSSTTEQQCTFTVGGEGNDVTATFDADEATTQTVSVTLAGSGSGSVDDTTDGGDLIYCSDDEGAAQCEGSYEPGTQLTLYASPDEGSSFAGFSGVTCEEDAPERSSTSEAQCTFTVGEDGDEVTATFTSDDESTLTVATTGTGRGYVDSDPTGIDCGRNMSTHADCSEDYAPGTYVTLTAHPQSGTRFDGFDTSCLEDDDRGKAAPTGPRLTCSVFAGEVDTVTAKFTSTGGGGGGGGTFPPTTGGGTGGGTTTGGGTQTGGGTSTGGGQPPVVTRPTARVVRRRARPHRRLVITCGSQACSATSTAVLRVRGKKIGSLDLGDAVDLDADAHTTIGLRITRALKAGIRAARRKHPGAKARLTVRVVFTQADGTTVTRRIRITIG